MDFQKYFKEFHYKSKDFPLYVHRKTAGSDQLLPLHWHQDLQFTLCLRGKIQLRLEEGTITLERNDVLFINRHILHQVVEMSPDAEYIELDFSEQLISFQSTSAMFQKCVKPYTRTPKIAGFLLNHGLDWEYEIKEHIQLLYRLHQTKPTPFFEYESVVHLTQIWLLICKHISEDKIITSHVGKDKHHLFTIQSMLGFIYENYQEKIDLKDIANSGHVSTTECARIFKHFTNKAPYHFLIDYRLKASLDHLTKHTELNISEISQSVGFNQPSNFIQKFTEKYGLTPHRYRLEKLKIQAKK